MSRNHFSAVLLTPLAPSLSISYGGGMAHVVARLAAGASGAAKVWGDFDGQTPRVAQQVDLPCNGFAGRPIWAVRNLRVSRACFFYGVRAGPVAFAVYEIDFPFSGAASPAASAEVPDAVQPAGCPSFMTGVRVPPVLRNTAVAPGLRVTPFAGRSVVVRRMRRWRRRVLRLSGVQRDAPRHGSGDWSVSGTVRYCLGIGTTESM